MTTVTLPREVVQQALEEATQYQGSQRRNPYNARLIEALRTALDAPAQPVDCRGCKNLITHNELCRLTLAPVTSPKPCTNFDKFQALPPISLTRVTK